MSVTAFAQLAIFSELACVGIERVTMERVLLWCAAGRMEVMGVSENADEDSGGRVLERLCLGPRAVCVSCRCARVNLGCAFVGMHSFCCVQRFGQLGAPFAAVVSAAAASAIVERGADGGGG